MNTKKKALLFLIITVVVLFSASVVTVTYAWFLSRYSENYDFEVESDSHVVLRYETALDFASGNQNTSTNKIIVAGAKDSFGALTPFDVFDVDMEDPAHTGKVRTAAQAVKFTATGAYWYGRGTASGALSFDLVANPQNNASYDLIHYGELGYVAIFEYQGKKFLLYNGNYYTNSTTVESTGGESANLSGNQSLALPTASTAFGEDGTDPWYLIDCEITAEFDEVRKTIFNNGLQLLPNTQFILTLYVFATKADDFMDPAWNGQTVELAATISVPTVNP